MRWCHPEHGWISPVVFIPLAERSGLINILGAWALRTACRQARAWQVAGKMKFYVSVNVSPSQFRQLDFTGLVNRTLTDSELEPSSLMLEITEGVLMQDPENTISIISGFSESGIKIAIDDFGTGYSSLSYLKKFPLSVLKIDKSFVDHIPQDPKDTAIVLAILELALGLGLVVVAEGVEIKEQLEFLKSKNCDLVQGYYTGKPMTASDFEEKLILCTR
jgi:EAL domain-containing protein (putative c-di-GMP-specific phosphodiesterase class I)